MSGINLQEEPVQKQPVGGGFGFGFSDGPSDFDVLKDLDELILRIRGMTIHDKNGKDLFKARLDQFGYCDHSIDISLLGPGDKVVGVLEKGSDCCKGWNWCISCCPSCAVIMEIKDTKGQIMGTFKQEHSICNHRYSIRDAAGEIVAILSTPTCFCVCRPIEFNLSDSRGNDIGAMVYQMNNKTKDLFKGEPIICLTFPRDMDTKIKTTILGSSSWIAVAVNKRMGLEMAGAAVQ